jgi:hypothetical protein
MQSIYRFFSSLQLTVWLLAASVILIFFGTLDQVHLGIFAAQEKYFQSIVALWGYPEQWPLGQYLRVIHLPLPGGYLLGFMMLLNLGCAHFRFFRARWSNAGIVLIHVGLVLLLLSELFTHLTRREHYLWFEVGQTAQHVTSFANDELVIIDRTAPDSNQVVAFPAAMLEPGKNLTHPRLPFRVQVVRFHENASISRGGPPNALVATDGLAPSMGLVLTPQPRTTRPNERNTTTAVVEIVTPDGVLGSWLVSNVFEHNLPAQQFVYQGRTYELAMRYERLYLPFSLKLLEFTHERYPGTNIPRNFASRVHLVNPQTGEDRETLIYMNHPLRYGGYTFYQSSFGQDSQGRADRASQFQVVNNPGWLVPYIACVLMSLGMVWQFAWLLGGRRRRPALGNGAATAAPPSANSTASAATATVNPSSSQA